MGVRFPIIFFLFSVILCSQGKINIKNLITKEHIYFTKKSKTPFSGSAFSFSKLTGEKILDFQIIDETKMELMRNGI